MTPAFYPLDLYRGDTYRWRFVCWTDPTKTTPADLTGVTAAAEFRSDYNGRLLVTLPCIVTLPNTIDAELSASFSEALPPAAVWDLQLTYPDGLVATVLAGPVTVRSDVTAVAV